MNIWHDTDDAPRTPRRVSPSQEMEVIIGTWPIGPGQSVWVTWNAISLMIRSSGQKSSGIGVSRPLSANASSSVLSERVKHGQVAGRAVIALTVRAGEPVIFAVVIWSLAVLLAVLGLYSAWALLGGKM